MTFRLRLLSAGAALLLAAGPVFAQSQNTDTGGALPTPASDVTGSFTQSDLFAFQSDEARIRMADIAAALAQSLQDGELGAGVGGGQSVAVSRGMADLLLAPTRKDRRASAEQWAEVLTTQGIPATEAEALARATAGLLDEGTFDADRFLPSLVAFNAVVNVAPSPFLAQPPQDFVAVRIVLTTLLDGAAS